MTISRFTLVIGKMVKSMTLPSFILVMASISTANGKIINHMGSMCSGLVIRLYLGSSITATWSRKLLLFLRNLTLLLFFKIMGANGQYAKGVYLKVIANSLSILRMQKYQ